MTCLSTIKNSALKGSLVFMHLSYTPALLAAGNSWFPKVSESQDMTTGKDTMTVASTVVKQGMMLLLFIVSVITFIKFIMIVSHGIEESKKHEGGSLAVFANFAVMGIIYLALSLASGYLGYFVIANFKI